MPVHTNDEYDIGKAFAAIEDELMASMIRNMNRHKVEEVAEDKQWSMWQAEQLKSLERYKRENQKKYGQQFNDINKQITELIRMARDEGEMDQEIAILRAIQKGFPAERSARGATAEFFKLNERKLEALIKATIDDMQKAETAVLRMANDRYRKVIFNAQVYANTGAGTYEKAVDMATRDFIAAGMNCVEYKNGARHTLSDYADMAIRTAAKRAYLQGEGTKRAEWGISTVIMNKRGNPCPKCLPFCGKVLIDDVWSGGSSRDGKYPLMSYAIEQGLYHPRCKDHHTTYFPGISTADDTWTDEELENIGMQAKKEAKQQYAKRQMERFGRLARYSLDEENRRVNNHREKDWMGKVQNMDISEFSPRKSKDGDFAVDWEKIYSSEYRKSLEKLSDKPKVVDAIEVRAKWILNNRDGLNTEELHAISMDTGKEIASVLRQQVPFGVRRTKSFANKLDDADGIKEHILLIHNHPRGLPPSIGDINALTKHKNVSGITVGHNGSVYYYTKPEKVITEDDFRVAMRHFKEYTEVTAMEKALEVLSRQYNFVFKRL